MKRKISGIFGLLLLSMVMLLVPGGVVKAGEVEGGSDDSTMENNITAENVNVEYDKKPHSISVQLGGLTDVSIQYKTGDGEYTEKNPEFVDAGSYTVSYRVKKDGYQPFDGDASVTINKKEIGIKWSEDELTYNGTPQKPKAIATKLCENDTCEITVEGEQINANEGGNPYTATATGLSNSNYKLPENNLTKEFTIKKATMTVSTAETITKDYDGKEYGIENISVGGPTDYKILYGETEEGCTSEDSPKYSEIGEYTIYYKITAENYNDYTGHVKLIIKAVAPPTVCAHTKTVFVGRIEATCVSAGYEGDIKCTNCNKIIGKGKTIPAKGYKWNAGAVTKKATDAAEGVFTYTCTNGCGHTKTEIIPRTSVSVELGKKANIISNASACQKMSLASASKYKKYLTFNTKTGVITTKKYYKVKINKSIPVKLTIGGKTYTVKIKIKIPAPKVKVTKKKIGNKGYKYTFKYNIKGASKIKVRMQKGGNKSINKEFDRDISKPKSGKYSYMLYSNKTMKKLNNKITFKVIAYYGKNQSETFTITK